MTSEPPVLVAGLPCSGSAVVAEALLRAGLRFGGPFLPLPDRDLTGAFVDAAVHDWHRRRLGGDGESGADAGIESADAPTSELEALLAERFDRSRPWGLRTPLLLPAHRFWESRPASPRWLVVVRDPAVQAWSQVERAAAPAGAARRRVARVAHALRRWRDGSRLALALAEADADRVVIVDAGRFAGCDGPLDRHLRERWRLPLAEVSLTSTLRPFLLRRRPLHPWIVALARLDPRTAAIWRALSRRALTPAPTAARAGRRLCVVAKLRFAPSESFIQEQLRRLPGDVHFVFQRDGAWHDRDCRPLAGTLALAVDAAAAALGFDRSAARSRALARFLARRRIEAVLANFGPLAVQALPACRAAGVPLVAHFHGNDAHRERPGEGSAAYYAPLFRAAAEIVAVSLPMIERLVALGAPRERIHLVPCGVDLADFPAGDAAAAPPHFVAAGRFVGKKGPLLTLLAFRRVLDEVPEARLTMLGDGVLRDSCKLLAGALGMATQVEFPGTYAHGELSSRLRAARAFLQHSLRQSDGDCEGSPVALLEASASGLPVVSTRHAGIPQAVLDGETGLLCDEGDVDAMAAAMLRLARDAPLAGEMGRRGRRHVAEAYAMARQVDRLAAVLERAARRESSPVVHDAAAAGEALREQPAPLPSRSE